MVCKCSVIISDFWKSESNDWLKEEWELLTRKQQLFNMMKLLPSESVPCGCKLDKKCIDCTCKICAEECHPECKELKDNFPAYAHRPKYVRSVPLSQWEKD